MSSTKLENITDKLKSNIFSIVNRKNTRSLVWDVFGEIRNEQNNIISDLVACRLCFKVIKYNRQVTSNLIRHECCKAQLEQNKTKQLNVDEVSKNMILNGAALLCINDVRPFTIFEGKGFENFTKLCVEMGAKFGGNINIEKMLPSDTAVSSNVGKIVNSLIPEIQKELAGIKKLSATTDLWTDNYARKSYMAVTVHYILGGKLCERVLAVQQFSLRQTSANFLDQITDVFGKFNLNDLDRVTFVTDRGSNIVKSLENHFRLNCIDHLLNNILCKAAEQIPDLLLFFDCCKKLVQYSKKGHSELKNLKTKLKNECVTRWNSKYEMCHSIRSNINDIIQILQDNFQTHRIQGINTNLLSEIVEFLKMFKDASNALEATKTPTLYLVYPYYSTLTKHCNEQDTDSIILKEFKKNDKKLLQTTVLPNIKIEHKTSTFLYPPCKQMALLTTEEKEEIYKYIKIYLETFHAEMPVPTPTITSTPIRQEESENIFADFCEASNTSSIFIDFIDSSNEVRVGIDMEITQYLNMSVGDVNINIMDWWESNKSVYPGLSNVHVGINSIPATSAASERAFSLSGNVISCKRSSLDPEKVNELIIGHSNLNTL